MAIIRGFPVNVASYELGKLISSYILKNFLCQRHYNTDIVIHTNAQHRHKSHFNGPLDKILA